MYTYFNGTLNIELKGEALTELQEDIVKFFESSKNPIHLNETQLQINGEWKDRGFVTEVIIPFIEEHGKLLSGSIRCEGEDTSDRWEIVLENSKAFRRELRSYQTLHRSESKLKAI